MFVPGCQTCFSFCNLERTWLRISFSLSSRSLFSSRTFFSARAFLTSFSCRTRAALSCMCIYVSMASQDVGLHADG